MSKKNRRKMQMAAQLRTKLQELGTIARDGFCFTLDMGMPDSLGTTVSKGIWVSNAQGMVAYTIKRRARPEIDFCRGTLSHQWQPWEKLQWKRPETFSVDLLGLLMGRVWHPVENLSALEAIAQSGREKKNKRGRR